MWDMQVRKAAHPGSYIPYVVLAGSDRSWNRRRGDGGEYLDRCSMQRLWLSPERYQLIVERAFLNHREQRITFLGVAELPGPDGAPLRAGTDQPLFHVEHAVGGTESQPLDRWRIVHLTEAPDRRLRAVFERIAASPGWPSTPRSTFATSWTFSSPRTQRKRSRRWKWEPPNRQHWVGIVRSYSPMMRSATCCGSST
jgi:hypothetical protein